MEVISTGKYIRISPKKARPVADLVRGKNAKLAFETLKQMPQRTAGEIRKVLGTAIANAENNFNLEKDALIVSRIMIDGGPVLKRHRPRGKGSASQIKKRTSHVTVVVSGDIKSTKKVEKPVKKEKEVVEDTKSTKAEKTTPGVVKNGKGGAVKTSVKSTMFRRKTG